MHRESSGRLVECVSQFRSLSEYYYTKTHETMESAIMGKILISFPPASTGGVISKTCNSAAIFMKSAASPKYRPGQILHEI